MKKTTALFLSAVLILSFGAGCGQTSPGTAAETAAEAAAAETPVPSPADMTETEQPESSPDDTPDAADIERTTEPGPYEALSLTARAEEWEYVESEKLGINYYQLTDVPYCLTPTDAAKEILNIYVPEEYINPDGSIDIHGHNNGWNADTAPIFFPNNIGGYMEADPMNVSAKNAAGQALLRGYVVVSPGARGRNSTTGEELLDGRAPEGLVDLKAAVRFLRYNDLVLAGDSEKILSDGTSAGGAMSALLATTGDVAYYDAYLETIGAVMDESDTIFGAFIFCPITDLDHADIAYEWYFSGVPEAYGGKGTPKGPVDPALSGALAELYPDYLNSLGLTDPETGEPLTLGETDTYTPYLYELINSSLNDYLAANFTGETEILSYLDELQEEGAFVEYADGTATVTSIADMVNFGAKRMKNVPAFDFMDAEYTTYSGENDVFGWNDLYYCHFSGSTRQALESAGYAALADAYAVDLENEALTERVYHMNPMNFLGNEAGGDAQHFYIRVGNEDSDSSPLISLNLATGLMNRGESTVNYKMQWEKSHAGDYEIEEMFAWADIICR